METDFLRKRPFPTRFVNLKRQLIPTDDLDTQKRLTIAWRDLLNELSAQTGMFKKRGSDVIPKVEFTDLNQLSSETIADIKKKGCVVIKNVVDDEKALFWKQLVKDYIAENPSFHGLPENNKQFYFMYWSKAQIQARAHPNVLESQRWLNSLYHTSNRRYGVSLDTPLVYADRLRLWEPGSPDWLIHIPHVDSGGIERWEDPGFLAVHAQIMNGNWRAHDPYDLDARLDINTNMYGTPHRTSVFRTFQGWLSMSDTGPKEGTLRVFPDVVLSTAYIMLRPFFRPAPSPISSDPLDANDWEFDISQPDFQGILPEGPFFIGPCLTGDSHPHLKLDDSMVSMPSVKPGDMVYWHCDVIHAVEQEHNGTGDSSVMYIPAVPETPNNSAYVERQKEHFLRGAPPPDFPQELGEIGFNHIGTQEEIIGLEGRRAMGFPATVSA